MIQDRPRHLLDNPEYSTLPPLPYAVDWSAVPDLVRASIFDLSGVQPVTGTRAEAAGGVLRDEISENEIALFREQGTQFQLISVVVSLLPAASNDECFLGKPFALSLIPASKKGEIDQRPVEFVEKIDLGQWLEASPAYVGYDCFSGEWSMYGGLSTLRKISSDTGYLDEIGIVIDQFFLATEVRFDDILTLDVGMPTAELTQKYTKRRNQLLFTPFSRVEARRVWGAESPIELFLVQELALRGVFPQLQMLIFENGEVFPSWYHIWRDIEFRHTGGLISEADLFFPEQRVAVFCDGRHHERRKQREKDARINARLKAIGIRPVRVPGRQIINDLPAAANSVIEAL